MAIMENQRLIVHLFRGSWVSFVSSVWCRGNVLQNQNSITGNFSERITKQMMLFLIFPCCQSNHKHSWNYFAEFSENPIRFFHFMLIIPLIFNFFMIFCLFCLLRYFFMLKYYTAKKRILMTTAFYMH